MARTGDASSERLALWVTLLGSIALALPIVLVRYPPMGDLAMHEGTMAIARHLHDASWVPPGHYYLVAPQANQLFFWAAVALGYVLPSDLACKLLVAALVAAAPLAMARFLARLGRAPALALLVGPVTCGWMLRWGLVANMCGFVVLLLALPDLERLARRPRASTVARTAGLSVLLFFAHESSALVYAGVAATFAALHSSRARAFLARAVPVVVVAALAAAQAHVSEGLLGASMRSIGSDYGPDPGERLALLPGAVFGGMSGGRLACAGGAWLVALAASAATRRERSMGPAPLRIALWRHRYAVLSAVLVLLFFAFPMSLAGTTLLAHRFLPPACACLVVACAARRGSRPLVPLLAAMAAMAMIGVEARAFAASDAEYAAVDTLVGRLPKNTAVAQLDLTPRPPGHVAPVPGAAGRALAERGGRMLFAMTDTPPNPVYVTAGQAWDEPQQRLVMTPYAFMPAWDFRRFAFLLERNESPEARAAVARALAPEGELVAEAGSWSLFRSTLEVGSLDAPDAPLPARVPETLGARISRQP